MRTCSTATIAKIVHLDKLPTKPAWLHLAIWDAQNYRGMSAERERRMCEALGIDVPKRKPYWRPCLPATLTTEQRAQVVALARLLEDKP